MLNPRDNFQALVERAMAVTGRAHMRPVIEKELLHYDILFALDKEGLLDTLTFQGGTSLRLCYGAQRFSEDLDFVGGYDFEKKNCLDMKSCLEDYIGRRYGLVVTVKEPNELAKEPVYRDIKIDKWRLSVVTSPDRPDLKTQKIKIEIANIPAYSREPKQLMNNYDFFPDGYSDTLIMTETMHEIMADKLISFVNCKKTIRHRDIWDLRWMKQQDAVINTEYLANKIRDYKIDDYLDKVTEMIRKIPEIIHGEEFRSQMKRFIPTEVQKRTLDKEKFYLFLVNETTSMFEEVQTRLRPLL